MRHTEIGDLSVEPSSTTEDFSGGLHRILLRVRKHRKPRTTPRVDGLVPLRIVERRLATSP
jgi:hypothetical protein